MTIAPVGSSAATNPASTSSVAQATLSADYEAFLQLLTAQVANQDPLEPMDSTTFVSQLAQLSQVEQSIITNSHLELISGQISAATSLSDAGLIGKTVLTSSSEFELGASGGVDLSYRLQENASSVTATILSEQGVALRRFEGLPTTAGGTHELFWDGNDFYGLPLPEGSYRVQIDAKNAFGETVAYETFVESEVESVLFADGFSQLQLANGDVIPSTAIEAVR
ncbi:flagellar hook assembly protein FlgD [Roseivivax sp. CAU 1753]